MSTATPQLSPLEQLMGQQQQTPSQQPDTSGMSPLEQLMSQKPAQSRDGDGQVTNDVGQQVVVPKDGENFSDTINRAVALTKQREASGKQQEAQDAETATIPKKAGEVLASAPMIGAAGAAVGPMLTDAVAPVLRHIATEWGNPAVEAIKSAAESHPIVAKLLTHALETAAGMKLASYLHAFSK